MRTRNLVITTRVGATQDLAELDIDLAVITQAGGWKSTRMPLRYAQKMNSARSGNGKGGGYRAKRKGAGTADLLAGLASFR